MANKLRLAAAALTDVGRRRERNQDHTTHCMPDDEKVLTEKGALFVVCDGMGGYAAGEVASEIAATKIQEAYYASSDANIISRIADAIKQANHAVFTYAQEHPETAGMGTTCVVLAIHDGRALYVNIGDSRGYLVRDGHMRQVTQDHSWVAEQVRAGVLTEDQARSHPHRNVITRSLGTQPTVSADLFIETLKDGDRVLLCSDGLHGYVEEREIERQVVEQTDLDYGAQQLIDMANANGGPDNITAVIVAVLEVPAPVSEIQIPSGPPEQQIVTRPMPAIKRSRRAPAARPRVPAKVAHDARRGSRSRTAAAVLTVVALVALLAGAAGVWDFTYGPYAASRAAASRLTADLDQARQSAQQASAQDPATALAALATARQRVLTDLQNPQLDAASAQNAQSVLDGPLASAVQAAVTHYNETALITPVSSSAAFTHAVSCGDGASTTPVPLTAPTAATTVTSSFSASGEQLLYAVSGGVLYQLAVPVDPTSQQPVGGSVACAAVHPVNVQNTLALASDGPTLYALTQHSATSFEVLSITTTGAVVNGPPAIKIGQRFTVDTKSGETPVAVAEQSGVFYIAYQSSTGGTPGIWVYRGNFAHGPAQTITLPQPAVSVVAATTAVFALLADGSLGSFGQAATSGTWQSIAVQVQNPLAPNDPAVYRSATPVPTVPAGTAANGGTHFAAGGTLIADPGLHSHVFVNDGAQNRIVRLVASATGPGLGLAAQYVYSAPLANITPLAVASSGSVLDVFAWSGGSLVAFPLTEPSA
ncbi:MAG: Stp1/IreP family PP2C-type Ser/Thr phosphatase [Ktedonobacterales bacterium]